MKKNNIICILNMVNSISKTRILAECIKVFFIHLEWVFYSVFFVGILTYSMQNNASKKSIILFLIVAGLGVGIAKMYNTWFDNVYKPVVDKNIMKEINKRVFKKVQNVDFSCYEDSDFFNRYTLASQEADNRIPFIIETLMNLFWGIVTSILIIVYMVSVDPGIVLFIIFPVIGNFYFGKKYNELVYKRSSKSISFDRMKDYTYRVSYMPQYSKEIRTTNIFSVLREYYLKGKDGKQDVYRKYAYKIMLNSFLRYIFNFMLIFMGVIIYTVTKTMIFKTMNITDFVILLTAMVGAAWIIIGVSENCVKMIEHKFFINNLLFFLEYNSQIKYGTKLVKDKSYTIKFNNVSFRYDEKNILKNINVVINPGEKIAIIGENGAGKSSFIKLLTRLYDPSQGLITLNDIDIKEYDLQQYRELYAVSIQNSQLYAFSVEDNVIMGKESNNKNERVEYALEKAGLLKRISELSEGMKSILTKEFDSNGVVLSGGETQKLFAARNFYANRPIMIFDEPTSALDAIAEYQMYRNILNICDNETVIFVSHRMSSAALADKVLFFEDGEITESGTHIQLLKNNKKYAEMYRMQADKYSRGELLNE